MIYIFLNFILYIISTEEDSKSSDSDGKSKSDDKSTSDEKGKDRDQDSSRYLPTVWKKLASLGVLKFVW